VDLMALTKWWFDRREKCRAVTTTAASGGSEPQEDHKGETQTGAAERKPQETGEWTVRPSTDEETDIFRVSEKLSPLKRKLMIY
jgi:hypothetical protein